MVEDRRYYVATGYRVREEARTVDRWIEGQNPGWSSAASWLHWSEEPPAAEAARRDVRDCRGADLLVWLSGTGMSPGRHVELGIALGGRIPVVVVDGAWRRDARVLRGVEPPEEGDPAPIAERTIFLELCAAAVPLRTLAAGGLDELVATIR